MVSCIVSDRSVSETWNEVISFVYFGQFWVKWWNCVELWFLTMWILDRIWKKKKVIWFCVEGRNFDGKIG